MLDRIKIVLVETSHQGNIGSTARAMKTMGLSRLCLVNPKDDYLGGESVALSAGASDVLQNAEVVSSLKEALTGCNLVFATSIRQRTVSIPLIDVKKTVDVIFDDFLKKESSDIAIIFGRENSGLKNDELGACNYHIKIATNPLYGSLNLSQAVQIICYEIYQKSLIQQDNLNTNVIINPDELKPSFNEMEMFYEHLEEVLRTIDFIDNRSSKKLILRLKKLYNKADLNKDELSILRGILSKTVKYVERMKDNS
tara:strand:+ start:1506 stop:2267 length:762 start_codon:yes stop_codon:yes gene_type:complete